MVSPAAILALAVILQNCVCAVQLLGCALPG